MTKKVNKFFGFSRNRILGIFFTTIGLHLLFCTSVFYYESAEALSDELLTNIEHIRFILGSMGLITGLYYTIRAAIEDARE